MVKEIFNAQGSKTYAASSIYEKFYGVFDPEMIKRYRDMWKKSKTYEIMPDYPLEIVFELNYSCNLRCGMCEISHNPRENLKGKMFDFELYKRIIDQGRGRHCYAVHLNSMNEPLLRPDLEDFISYAREADIPDIAITTNAMLLTRERGRRLIEAGLTRIQISIDAYTRETYEQVRKGGDFDRVVQNTLDFIETRNQMGALPIIRVSFLNREENTHEVDDFCAFWQSKVDYLTVQKCFKPITLSEYKEESAWRFDMPPLDFHCGQPNQYMIVRVDGSTVACDSMPGHRRILPNAKDHTIEEIWNSSAFTELRALHLRGEYYKDDICNHCITATSYFEEAYADEVAAREGRGEAAAGSGR